jgi:acyl-CoA synthetase (AMP-forming)/AMP-acid ligase II
MTTGERLSCLLPGDQKDRLHGYDHGRELTYPELAAAVREGGAWLASRGVRAGDVLALCSPNRIEFVVTWYAAS